MIFQDGDEEYTTSAQTRTYLVGGDAIHERSSDTISCDHANNQVRKAVFQRYEEVEYGSLEWVI